MRTLRPNYSPGDLGFKRLFGLRRPSLINRVPTAIAHFCLVESAAMSFVLVAWVLIMSSRLTGSWISEETHDLLSCTQYAAYSLLANPFQSDIGTMCLDAYP